MNVYLIDVDKNNYKDVMSLEVEPGQENFVAPNSESIAESHFNEYCKPRVICFGEEIVGFAMYERCVSEGKPNEYNLYRMMIDKSFQNQGIGSTAMTLLLDEMKQQTDCYKISVCYDETSERHKLFYQRFGFIETGYCEKYEEMLAEIIVER
ncbi:GNAT family N-acetyltransferase [Xenorhabdus hominickii]|uniref:GNAT family N-acetyltransferase n=1 Tax=Xenorhabdus hominickii TaxID=351679 RepID=A0A2G0QGC8_XENHO|nr:GNAT family N-acetyltransferase [Xenorhabdus hominickii]AOM42286.1 GNAT family N-acetyltransferase [Xenorhabdus hominickii]PHM58290.1 GNAT family N-acetyltransferase [Xenorhabdus hominickii]